MAEKGWSWLLAHRIVEAAKALGGAFKLVMLTPKTVREMTQLNPVHYSARRQSGWVRQSRWLYGADVSPEVQMARTDFRKASWSLTLLPERTAAVFYALPKYYSFL